MPKDSSHDALPEKISGVFGESVTVMEGDSVTLHTNVTEILNDKEIVWSFNTTLIARVIQNNAVYDDLLIKDRLQLDNQTGDLTITNIRTTDSGLYSFGYKNSSDGSVKTFSVTCVRDTGMKSLSVMEGDSVTLYTDVPDIRKYDRYRDRLQLDHETGSLIIINIETSYSGIYEVEMSSSSGRHTIHKTFNVTVGVLSVSVMEGDSVTLHTNAKLHRFAEIVWSFNTTLIATVIQNNAMYANMQFNDRLQLDIQTGDLSITNIRTTDTGLYRFTAESKYSMSEREHIDYGGLKTFSVTCVRDTRVRSLSVMEGDSVTLCTDVTDIQKYDVIRWKFEQQDLPIAEINITAGTFNTYDDVEEIIRLHLNHETGSLTIRNTETSYSGIYEVEMSSSSGRHTIHKTFSVTVEQEESK
ncbi:T-lymphocyte surface antigen Ly-9 [Labeo rohita]|uniref:T-lymphocyte surface antigen Ly-9 n=1 Tax=Labeo rohita TaxID=84645 RepID=A0ABQ8LM74_LABRO|nr:T-lymphocyte surface antigen Ly-9 [Labeo rohita]